MFVIAFAADPQYVKPLVGGVGISVWMNSECTNSRGTTPGVGRLGVGMNFISSLPRTSVVAVRVVGGGDVRVVGNKDVVEDVDGDRDVSLWANVWDGPASLCAMKPMS